ncbi:hypothetical protein HLB42_21655 (plasmid) [Deinococcus sp. D7000]|nr:hypothetical protein HLB42_13930 [Deinococcus sp. D7000]QLG13548.1 hypothetical protein HLB42_21655 [Deinococcus sp. D7000]
MTDLTANDYAGAAGEVPDARAGLWSLLQQHEPAQPLALARYLNATPALTSLEQLTDGEVAAMRWRLTDAPQVTLRRWAEYQAAPFTVEDFL